MLKTTARLTNVSPMQLGIVLAVIYGALGIIASIFILIVALTTMNAPQHNPAGFGAPAPPIAGAMGVVFAVFTPLFYAGAGFISGIITAALYNLVAKWTGGVRYTVVLDPA